MWLKIVPSRRRCPEVQKPDKGGSTVRSKFTHEQLRVLPRAPYDSSRFIILCSWHRLTSTLSHADDITDISQEVLM